MSLTTSLRVVQCDCETLDGEPMANFINGSCLKRFHEPLTDEMLEKMHAAKTRKLALETMKMDAQEEAKIRAAKAKAKRHQVSAVNLHNNGMDDYIEPLLLEIGIDNENHTCAALLDSGASVNIMAEIFFNKFVSHSLSATDLQLNTAVQTINQLQGHSHCHTLCEWIQDEVSVLCHFR